MRDVFVFFVLVVGVGLGLKIIMLFEVYGFGGDFLFDIGCVSLWIRVYWVWLVFWYLLMRMCWKWW